MDANGTRFHLFLTQNDWGGWNADGMALDHWWRGSPPSTAPVAWNDATAELTLRRRLFRFVAAPADVAPSPESRRGAAVDRFSNIYWIDETPNRIHVQSVGSGR